MEQVIEAVVKFQIPADKILVDKVEYLELKDQSDYGKLENLGWFMQRIGRGRTWTKSHLLDNPKFQKQYDALNGDGFVFFKAGDDSGGDYKFIANKAKDFIENELWRWC